MKVCVLNGSPKGQYSVTLQTLLYIEKKFNSCSFTVLDVGQKIKAFEKDMSKAVEEIKKADLIVFSYPVYTFIATSQLHRFIALLKKEKLDLTSKFATQVTTSKHFYDVTAHRYIMENAMDLGFKYINGLSADMDDLTKEQGRREALAFWKFVMYSVENNIFEENKLLPEREFSYSPGEKIEEINHSAEKTTIVLTDCEENDTQLKNMILDFQKVHKYGTKVINLREFPFSGGCLGCFKCAATGKCVYKDGFDDFLRNKIQTADSIVYAFRIKDHSMGWIFKMYDDRQFCNGHRTVTEGMPIGYIVCGDYEREFNLKTIIEARADVGHNYLAGVACDFKAIESMSKKLCYSLENSYVLPRTFYGVGGMKIFRDLIYVMRGLMKADHKFYKKHGVYDFPQKQRGRMLFIMLVGKLASSPKMQKKMGNKMTEGMLMPYKKVLENADKDNL